MKKTKPKIIGLTGPIGSGKNEVCRILRRRGARVIDADRLGHGLLVPQSDLWKELVKTFGSRILQQGGKVNRKKLGEMVFENPKLLKKLNKIMHPAMRERIKSEIRNTKSETLIIINAAVLKEMRLVPFVDEVWVVLAKREKRMKRLMNKGLTKEQAALRVRSQMSDGEYLKMADRVIRNNSTREKLKRAVVRYPK